MTFIIIFNNSDLNTQIEKKKEELAAVKKNIQKLKDYRVIIINIITLLYLTRAASIILLLMTQ